MPSESPLAEDPAAAREPLDEGLLSPVSVGHDGDVTDAAVLRALVSAEVALARAYARTGHAPRETVAQIDRALDWRGTQEGCVAHGLDVAGIARAAVAGGNPVIPLVGALKAAVPEASRPWVHRGATSQDILDTALMRVAASASARVAETLRETERSLAGFAGAHRDTLTVARTLTQHAVPTTVGLRAAGWLGGVRRARRRLDAARAALPAQLAGAGGTLASFVEITGSAAAALELTAAFAAEAGLAVPDAPWHTHRWPVTELGDALVQAVDAVGKIAADVATLSRTEVGELAEGTGGGSSAMPQKQNPAASVLIRSAAIRAPQLGATLHVASALAVDERPDGAWHAEWPALRELLRTARGATAHAAALVAGLRVDDAAVARNLATTRGLVLAERLSLVLGPLIGAQRVAEIVTAVARGDDLGDRVRRLPEAAALDIDGLLDAAGYTGAAASLTDHLLEEQS